MLCQADGGKHLRSSCGSLQRSVTNLINCLLALTLASILSSCGGTPAVEHYSARFSSSSSTETLRSAALSRGILVGAAAASDNFADADYARVLGTEFNHLQPEWEMKFATLHPRDNSDPGPYDFTRPDRLTAFAAQHSMLVRGHVLLWHEALPDWLKRGGYSVDQLSAIAQDHITTVVQHFSGSVYAWDVVNEAFNDNGSLRSTLWYDSPGIGYARRGTRYIEQALVWAHQADPAIALFYNDYGAEALNAKSNAIYAMAKDFKARGVPLSGIGFQMHLDLSSDNDAFIQSMRANLKRFSDLGLQVQITEMDVRLTNDSQSALDAQANLYFEVTRACLDTPNCTLVQTWGFTDKFSWINSFYPGDGWALLWDSAYQKKPSYFATLDGLTATQTSR